MKKQDFINRKFNRLLVKEFLFRKNNSNFFKCFCDCGKEKIVSSSHLKTGHTKSCGCYQKEISIKNGKISKHNLIHTRLYRIWSCIKNRCLNKKDYYHYKDYGDRNISICNEWFDFKTFYDWALLNGYQETLTIDRINNNGNYEPSNCRWVTTKDQNSNKRNSIKLNINGKIQSLKELAKEFNKPYVSLYWRYKNNKPIIKGIE